MYFYRKGGSVLFCTERVVHISIDCYDPARAWHLELEVCIVWHRIESSECGSSEQCVVTTTERDDIKTNSSLRKLPEIRRPLPML